MNKKLFLTSAIAMGFVSPTIAEPTNTGSFPSNGYMQEDYTYTNAATSTNMAGVTEGEVNAVAEYENILYQIGAGQYLPAGGETVINCDQSGYFCPGVNGDVTYDANNPQGLTSCSTATNGDFTSSDGTGSSAESCFRACNVNNMGSNGSIATIAHATVLSGNDYYGNGADTCVPTACEPGWHVKDATPDLMTVIGASEAGTSYGYVSRDGENTNNTSEYGLSTTNDRGKFVVDYGNNGIIKGHARCGTQSGTGIWDGASTPSEVTTRATLNDSTGQYCWCQLDGYTAKGSQTTIALSGPWVFDYGYDLVADCGYNCAEGCAYLLQNGASDSLVFRAAMFNAYAPTPASCEANRITINWTDASSADISANNAGTATYGEDVRTPVKATTKPGQRFKGWRFVAPTPVQVGE